MSLVYVIVIAYYRLFVITPAGKKTKTQAKNSRKKLNCWEDFTSSLENSRKKLNFPLKDQNFLKDGTFYVIFKNKKVQKVEF